MLCHPGSSSTPPERQLRTLNREEPVKPGDECSALAANTGDTATAADGSTLHCFMGEDGNYTWGTPAD